MDCTTAEHIVIYMSESIEIRRPAVALADSTEADMME